MCGPGAQVLCEVEITSHDQSRDGRYYIEVVGRRRLRCERDWQDNSNLRVAVVSELTDDAILPQQEPTLAAAAPFRIVFKRLPKEGGVDGARRAARVAAVRFATHACTSAALGRKAVIDSGGWHAPSTRKHTSMI